MTRRVLRDLRRMFSRRRALQGIGAAFGTGLVGGGVGCKVDVHIGDDGTTGDDDGTTGATTSTSSSEGSSGAVDTTGATDEGSSSSTGDGPPTSDCSATSDLSAEELLAPIDYIVVLMMENRSFDHMFGALALEGRMVDGFTGNESNPGPTGDDVVVHALEDTTVDFDPPHDWDPAHAQWNNGANDGFVVADFDDGSPTPDEVMGYYTREFLPVSYALADNYSLCERWFASVMGPTWPNRFHLHLATSNGVKDSTGISNLPSIFDRLTDKGITNIYYHSNLPFTLTYGKVEGVEPIENFFAAAADGTLPQFCMVDPTFTNDNVLGNDDHPIADVAMGQAFIASVYQALAASPLWNRCLLILTYDEHGGFFDHVAPGTTTDPDPEFQQLGFRVPAVVIGPHVRRGCLSSTQFDHVSIVSTVTKRFGLVPLNDRVTATADLSSCIDPNFVDDPQPPAPLPMMVVRRPQVRDTTAPAPRGHHELRMLAEQRGFPTDPALAQRSIDTVLAWGERLGVLRIVD